MNKLNRFDREIYISKPHVVDLSHQASSFMIPTCALERDHLKHDYLARLQPGLSAESVPFSISQPTLITTH